MVETRKDSKQPAAERKRENWEEKYKRALADYLNLERRVKKKQEEMIKFANTALILKLLPIVDDLEKAVKLGRDSGVKLILRNFKEVLTGEGVEQIDTNVGDKFDPETMEAVETDGAGDEVRVSEVLRKGYRLRGKMIRPTQVQVSKNKQKGAAK